MRRMEQFEEYMFQDNAENTYFRIMGTNVGGKEFVDKLFKAYADACYLSEFLESKNALVRELKERRHGKAESEEDLPF
jgi:hypothetical protein